MEVHLRRIESINRDLSTWKKNRMQWMPHRSWSHLEVDRYKNYDGLRHENCNIIIIIINKSSSYRLKQEVVIAVDLGVYIYIIIYALFSFRIRVYIIIIRPHPWRLIKTIINHMHMQYSWNIVQNIKYSRIL